MSWDTIHYDLFAKCACGKGKVIRHIERRDDDWNRSETYCIGEEIECSDCCNKYHIEHVIHHYYCPPWKGDGISDRAFLVPNEIKMPPRKNEHYFVFSDIDEEIVASLSLEDIKASIDDMKTNKYTTRLQLESSERIVDLYQGRYRKRNLKLITPILEDIIQNYNKYEWTHDKMIEYRHKEKEEIENNKKEIERVIEQSFELEFRRG